MSSGINWDKVGRGERARRNGTVSMYEQGEEIIRKKKKNKQITPFRPKFGPLSRSTQERIIEHFRQKTENIYSKRRAASLARERRKASQ